MMIILAHGGRDLESCKLKSWVEAASVLWQVTAACARAEEVVEFEVSGKTVMHIFMNHRADIPAHRFSTAICTGATSLSVRL